jgi:hypothetical protein
MTDAEYQGHWFARVTKPQLAVYNERMAVAYAYQNSPRWERIRAAAHKEFQETTQGARVLYERAMADLEAFGEVSEETYEAMDRFERGEADAEFNRELNIIRAVLERA